MTKRRRRSDAEWQQMIEQQEHCGLSAIAFCQQQGLSSKTFYKSRQLLLLKRQRKLSFALLRRRWLP